MKTVPELLSLVKFLTDLKIKEKGSKPSVVAKARKAVSSIQMKDHEDAGVYVARGQRLWEEEKAVTTNHTSLEMVIHHMIDGLKSTYNSIIERWQLDEITNGDITSTPKSIEELANVLTNYEQRSRKYTPSKPGNPNNFVTTDQDNRKFIGRRGCVTCHKAGRDSNHDYKSCVHSIKWRKKNNEKKILVTGKRRGQEDDDSKLKSTIIILHPTVRSKQQDVITTEFNS